MLKKMSNVKIKVSTASVSTLISVHALLKDYVYDQKRKKKDKKWCSEKRRNTIITDEKFFPKHCTQI